MIEATSTSETSVNYQTARRNSPEDSHLQSNAYFHNGMLTVVIHMNNTIITIKLQE
jgi:hypothetical protein